MFPCHASPPPPHRCITQDISWPQGHLGFLIMAFLDDPQQEFIARSIDIDRLGAVTSITTAGEGATCTMQDMTPTIFASVTPLPHHRQRAGVRWVAPTGRPRAGYALGCAGHGRPSDSRRTMAAGTAPGASCAGRPHSPPTRGLTAGRPAPESALGAPAPAGRVVPRRCTGPG